MYVYGCTFDGCSATSNGGAIACANASSSGADTKTDVTIADTKDYTDDVKTKLDDGDTTYQRPVCRRDRRDRRPADRCD